MRKVSTVCVMIIAACVIAGCENMPFLKPAAKKSQAPKPPVGAVIVARVGDFYITAEDLDREVENYNALVTQQNMPQNKIDTREKKIDYLRNELVRKYMLYQDALDKAWSVTKISRGRLRIQR